MVRLRTILLMWLVRLAWRLLSSAIADASVARLRTAQDVRLTWTSVNAAWLRTRLFFREVNERVEAIAHRLRPDVPYEFVCECANADCTFRVVSRWPCTRPFAPIRSNSSCSQTTTRPRSKTSSPKRTPTGSFASPVTPANTSSISTRAVGEADSEQLSIDDQQRRRRQRGTRGERREGGSDEGRPVRPVTPAESSASVTRTGRPQFAHSIGLPPTSALTKTTG